jgi:hypothetical protein
MIPIRWVVQNFLGLILSIDDDPPENPLLVLVELGVLTSII